MKNIAEKINTHGTINPKLCGIPVSIENGASKLEFLTTDEMAVDNMGLVHGGFIFGLADYAAMVAVNHPNVVLGSSEVKFLKPVKINEKLLASAETVTVKGKKHIVSVTVLRENEAVFSGTFTCFILEKHVLE